MARQRRPGLAQFVLLLLLAACGRSTGVGDDGGGGEGGSGASMAGRGGGAGAGGAAGKGGTGGRGGSAGSSGTAGVGVLPEDECTERLAILDRSCNADADCVVGAWNHCTVYDRTELLGVSVGALDELSALAALCGRPSAYADCPGEGGGISPTITEDGLEPWGDGMTAAAACVDGRCTSYSSRCGRDLCGNGSVDECRVTPGDQPTFEQQFDFPAGAREACDGDTFGELSCVTYGYARGNLTCGEESCVVDEAACVVCSQPSGPLLDCRTDEGGRVEWFVAAASEAELAVLFDRAGELHLARFAPDLSPLGDVILPSSGAPVDWGDGALARADGAWVAVATRLYPDGYSLFTLPDGGEPEEHARSTGEIVEPFLVAQPSGPPLFVYGMRSVEGLGSSQAQLVSEDLTTYGAGYGLGVPPITSGAWVGDAFLLTRVVDGLGELLRLDAAVTEPPVTIPLEQAIPEPVSQVLIGSDGETAYVLENTALSSASVLHLDAMGVLLDPVRGYGILEAPSAPVVLSDGAYVAAGDSRAGGPALGVRVVGGGAQAFIESELVASPAPVQQAVGFGDELVIVFSNERGLGLARYRP